MPNWCENVVQVRGIAAERANFRRRATTEEQPLTLAGHVPEPDPYPGPEAYADTPHPVIQMMLRSPATFDGWYAWRLLNWGCKWDIAPENAEVIDPDPQADAAVLEYRFLSPWNPPLEWMLAASRRHPELSFRLISMEPACDYACALDARGGVTIDGREAAPAELRDELAAVGLEVWEPEIDGP